MFSLTEIVCVCIDKHNMCNTKAKSIVYLVPYYDPSLAFISPNVSDQLME